MKFFKKVKEGEMINNWIIYYCKTSYIKWIGIVIPLTWYRHKEHDCMEMGYLDYNFKCHGKVQKRLGIKIYLPRFIFGDWH